MTIRDLAHLLQDVVAVEDRLVLLHRLVVLGQHLEELRVEAIVLQIEELLLQELPGVLKVLVVVLAVGLLARQTEAREAPRVSARLD